LGWLWWKLPWQEQGNWGNIFQYVGSLFTAVALVFALITTWSQNKQLKDQSENAQKQIASEQFKNAIEFLGSDNDIMVQGGIESLHNLAESFPKLYSKAVGLMFSTVIPRTTSRS